MQYSFHLALLTFKWECEHAALERVVFSKYLHVCVSCKAMRRSITLKSLLFLFAHEAQAPRPLSHIMAESACRHTRLHLARSKVSSGHWHVAYLRQSRPSIISSVVHVASGRQSRSALRSALPNFRVWHGRTIIPSAILPSSRPWLEQQPTVIIRLRSRRGQVTLAEDSKEAFTFPWCGALAWARFHRPAFRSIQGEWVDYGLWL